MFRALWSWIVCVLVTVVVSLHDASPSRIRNLINLVYGCTEIPSEGHLPLWQRPIFWAGVVGGGISSP